MVKSKLHKVMKEKGLYQIVAKYEKDKSQFKFTIDGKVIDPRDLKPIGEPALISIGQRYSRGDQEMWTASALDNLRQDANAFVIGSEVMSGGRFFSPAEQYYVRPVQYYRYYLPLSKGFKCDEK
jgi:hypothetical protein